LRASGIPTVAIDLSLGMAALSGPPYLAADEEFLPFGPDSFDLVVANLSLHWVNDLPGALIQIRRAMKPDGLLLASLPLLGTLDELRRALTEAEAELSGGASPRISPFPELRDCAGLLQRAGFSSPVADQEEIELLYGNPLALLHDLQAGGESNAIRERSRHMPPAVLFPNALMRMPTNAEGRLRVTLRLGIMTGWSSAGAVPQVN
jgi:NADH dehydrogenase [ubiquinone] 1 alpha subcomplex assembly factor 5